MLLGQAGVADEDSTRLDKRLKQGQWGPRTLTVRPESPWQAQLARRPVEARVASTLAYTRVLIEADTTVITGRIRSSRAGWKRRDSSDLTVSQDPERLSTFVMCC